uniref:Uncharacterized protein n=1 Tax=Steinernema glaseri TaxID=37863 RepID=A0A1I8ASV0_9BILA
MSTLWRVVISRIVSLFKSYCRQILIREGPELLEGTASSRFGQSEPLIPFKCSRVLRTPNSRRSEGLLVARCVHLSKTEADIERRLLDSSEPLRVTTHVNDFFCFKTLSHARLDKRSVPLCS